MIIKIIYPLKYENEKKYIVETVFSHFFNVKDFILEFSNEIKPNECHIINEGQPSFKSLILNNNFFDHDEEIWLKKGSLPKVPIEYYKLEGLEGKFLNNDIPVLYGKKSGKIISEFENTIYCDIDLFGGIFFFLTLYEEVVISKFDNHDRFNYLDSIIYTSNLNLRPVVNEYLEILKALIIKIGFIFPNDNRKYQLILSHDVDVPFSHNSNIFYFIRNISADIIIRKSLIIPLKKILAKVLPFKYLKYKIDPYNNFEFLMNISDHYGIKSTFYFIATNGMGGIDGHYEIEDNFFLNLINNIKTRGHYIGLHPSYYTYNNVSLLKSQLEKLKIILNQNKNVHQKISARQHYLRWNNPITWQIYDELNIQQDASIGSEFYLGFRCGTCYEYPVFNLLTRKKLNLMELPLLVMDICAFKLKKSINNINDIEIINKACRFYNGQMTLLYHNNYLVTKNQKNEYKKLLSKLI